MRKVLLLLENYSELSSMESVLKRIGFDVVGIQSSYSLPEKMVSFAPDVVVLPVKGSKFVGSDVAGKIRKRRGMPKVLFLQHPGQTERIAGADSIYEMPFHPTRFVEMLSQLLQFDVEPLREKLQKFNQPEIVVDRQGMANKAAALEKEREREKLQIVKGKRKVKPPTTELGRKYAAIAEKVDINTERTLNKARVQAFLEEQKNLPVPNEESLDEARQEFVRKLFKK